MRVPAPRLADGDPATPVIVVSHGFQSHYELGFVNGLAANGRHVVLLGSDTTLRQLLHPAVKLLNIRGSQDPARSRLQKAWGMLRYHARLVALAVRYRHSPVVIIGLLKPEWLVGVVEGLLLRLLSKHLALVVHNILPHDRHTPAMVRVYRLIYRIPHLLLVHTPHTGRQLESEFEVSPDSVVVVPHGLNDAIRLPEGGVTDVRRALGLQHHNRVLLLFGSVSRYKRLELVLDALALRPGWHLLMAGRCGNDAYGLAIRRRLQSLVEEGRAVWFDRHVDDDLVGRLFAAADVTVLPYQHIDQSGVLMLALSLGVPAIVARVGGLGDLINATNGLFLSEASGEAIAQALDEFEQQPLLREREAVRSSVRHLAWRETLASYLQRLEALDGTTVLQRWRAE
jgi:glycosyltransferase involved in cell wall biosynthesis